MSVTGDLAPTEVERKTATTTSDPTIPTRPSPFKFFFGVCGIWMIGLGLYFIALRPPLLPEDFRYMGTSPGEIHSVLERSQTPAEDNQ